MEAPDGLREGLALDAGAGLNLREGGEGADLLAGPEDGSQERLAVEGLGEGITLTNTLPDAPAATHRLTLSLRKEAAGDFRKALQIKTDLQSSPVTVTVEGTVTP